MMKYLIAYAFQMFIAVVALGFSMLTCITFNLDYTWMLIIAVALCIPTAMHITVHLEGGEA